MSQLEERSSSRGGLDRSEDSFRLVSTLQARRIIQQRRCAGPSVKESVRPGLGHCSTSGLLQYADIRPTLYACSCCRCYLQPLAACCRRSFAVTPLTSSAASRAPWTLSGMASLWRRRPPCASSAHGLHVLCCHVIPADMSRPYVKLDSPLTSCMQGRWAYDGGGDGCRQQLFAQLWIGCVLQGRTAARCSPTHIVQVMLCFEWSPGSSLGKPSKGTIVALDKQRLQVLENHETAAQRSAAPVCQHPAAAGQARGTFSTQLVCPNMRRRPMPKAEMGFICMQDAAVLELDDLIAGDLHQMHELG